MQDIFSSPDFVQASGRLGQLSVFRRFENVPFTGLSLSYPSVLHEGVRVVFLFHEVLEDFVVALRRCEPYWRAAKVRLALRRRTALHQEFHDFEVTRPRRAMQRCPAVLVGCVDLGTLTQEDLDHLVVAVSRRNVQPSFTVTIGAVQQLGRSAEKQTHYRYVATEAGEVQRIEAVLRRRCFNLVVDKFACSQHDIYDSTNVKAFKLRIAYFQ